MRKVTVSTRKVVVRVDQLRFAWRWRLSHGDREAAGGFTRGKGGERVFTRRQGSGRIFSRRHGGTEERSGRGVPISGVRRS